ncbi:hypothetical protein TSOC_012256 [Tetrabaena socialis]|uniref:YqaJ viral recombinase domain-containing protein n=1 Tax=Tetrabaena socialis TaxID=47790 RepID=A0A2J7ZNJ8_9CHLO|nr:hypothetical protein TSOC_012256 [Tetrabaena socialis]|eukprot:PNH01828.1 hypothetical protein TSOC_012256 [Tetrabaena socialis]
MSTLDVQQVIDRLYLRFQGNVEDIEDMLSVLSPGIPRGVVHDRVAKIDVAKEALAVLLQTPSITQRTPAWYEARMGMITASDIAQALGAGKFGTQKQLIWKKCLPSDDDAFASLANCPPIKWGTMYEDVAQQIYCQRNRVTMHEFGLLKHPVIDHIGASPDGISELGVMLEIKCPYRRQITGEVPVQYLYQIQGQLEVCGLSECDFLELKLEESSGVAFYDGIDEILPERGIVAEFYDKAMAKAIYSYSGVNWSAADLQAFEAKEKEKDATVKFHYWRVHTYSCVRVYRDGEFVQRMLPEVASVWAKIQEYRSDPTRMEEEVGLPPIPRKRPAVEYAFRETQSQDVTAHSHSHSRSAAAAAAAAAGPVYAFR